MTGSQTAAGVSGRSHGAPPGSHGASVAAAGATEARAGTTIKLVNCAKTFDDGTRALEPLDLEIESGETVVILGPSGCGKTTTLRIIAGLEAPDPGGRVLFDGVDVTRIPIERRNVGMVFQSYALFPNMTVEENVAYGLKVRRLPAAERTARVDEMLAMMHIGELRRRRIDQLSGGQKQRVALARALAVRPRVLLLDEPLTALDAKLRDELRIEIDGLLRRLGMTVVYVTHDQAEAMALGDRIVVMSHGRVAQIGRPREIYLRPANRFVADFVGTMNRVTGLVRNGYLEVTGGRIPWSRPPAAESSGATAGPARDRGEAVRAGSAAGRGAPGGAAGGATAGPGGAGSSAAGAGRQAAGGAGTRSEAIGEAGGGEAAGGKARGGRIEVLFRPESVTIVDPRAADLRGRVLTSFFLGDRTRLVVEGVGPAPIIVETTDRREFAAGDDIHLRIDPEALLVLDR